MKIFGKLGISSLGLLQLFLGIVIKKDFSEKNTKKCVNVVNYKIDNKNVRQNRYYIHVLAESCRLTYLNSHPYLLEN